MSLKERMQFSNLFTLTSEVISKIRPVSDAAKTTVVAYKYILIIAGDNPVVAGLYC